MLFFNITLISFFFTADKKDYKFVFLKYHWKSTRIISFFLANKVFSFFIDRVISALKKHPPGALHLPSNSFIQFI